MNSRNTGWMLLAVACVQGCSGGDPQRDEPTAQARAGAIIGAPAISGPIELDAGTPNWNYQGVHLWLSATSDADEHLLFYDVPTPWGTPVVAVPIRDGEAGTPFEVTDYSLMARTPTGRLVVHGNGSVQVLHDDGTSTDPVPLPLPCTQAGLAWGTDMAMLTDTCGNGVMLNGAGEPVGEPFVILEDLDDYYDYYSIVGGGVAFDGEYFLTTYAWRIPSDDYEYECEYVCVCNYGYGYENECDYGYEYNGCYYEYICDYADVFVAVARAYGFTADGAFTDSVDLPGIGALVSNGTSFLHVGGSAFVSTITDGVIHVEDSVDIGDEGCAIYSGVYPLGLADDFGFVFRDFDRVTKGLKFSQLSDCGYSGDATVLDEPTESPDACPTCLRIATGTADEVLTAQDLQWFRYDSNFLPLDDTPHSIQVRRPLHTQPTVAYAPAGYFVNWLEVLDIREGDRSLGRRVTELGVRVEDEPSELSTSTFGVAASKLLSASNGTLTLTVHANGAGLHIDLIDDAGNVTAVPNPLEATPTPYLSFSATAHADGFLLAFGGDGGGYQALRIDSSGAAGAPFAIGPVAADSSATASTYDGVNGVVVWTAQASTTTRTLYGVRIDATGSVLDTPPLPILTYPSDPLERFGSGTGPTLVRTSEGFVVVWTEPSGTDAVLRAQRLAQDLTLVGDAIDIAEVEKTSAYSPSPAVAAAWDGESLWFAWLSTTDYFFATLWGRRFTAELEVGDEEPFVIEGDAEPTNRAALTAGPPGQLLIAYGKPLRETYELRIEGRLLSSTGFADGTPCSDDSVCVSGACEAGLCGLDAGTDGSAGAPTDGAGGATTDGSGGATTDGSGGATTDGSGGATTDGAGGATTDGAGGATTDGSGGVATDGAGGAVTDGSAATGASGGSSGASASSSSGMPTTGDAGGSGSGGSGGATSNAVGGNNAAGGAPIGAGGQAGDGGVGGDTGRAGEAGAPSGGTHAGSSGSGGSPGSGGLDSTEGSTTLDGTNGGSGGTSAGGGGGGDCSCSVPGRASQRNLLWPLLLGTVLVGRRRRGPKTASTQSHFARLG